MKLVSSLGKVRHVSQRHLVGQYVLSFGVELVGVPVNDFQVAMLSFRSGELREIRSCGAFEKFRPTSKFCVALINEIENLARQCDGCLYFLVT